MDPFIASLVSELRINHTYTDGPPSFLRDFHNVLCIWEWIGETCIKTPEHFNRMLFFVYNWFLLFDGWSEIHFHNIAFADKVTEYFKAPEPPFHQCLSALTRIVYQLMRPRFKQRFQLAIHMLPPENREHVSFSPPATTDPDAIKSSFIEEFLGITKVLEYLASLNQKNVDLYRRLAQFVCDWMVAVDGRESPPELSLKDCLAQSFKRRRGDGRNLQITVNNMIRATYRFLPADSKHRFSVAISSLPRSISFAESGIRHVLE